MTRTIQPIFVKPVTLNEEELRTQTKYVRTFATFSHPAELTTIEMMHAIEVSGALDFWNDPEEDIYCE